MKNIFRNYRLFIAAAIFMAPAILRAQTFTYTVKGKVGALPATAKAYLMRSIAGSNQTDSTAIKNGSFSFKGKIDQPESAYLIINKKGTGINIPEISYTSLYLEKGLIHVTSPGLLDKARIAGGLLNTDNAKLIQALTPSTAKTAALEKEYQAASEEQRKSKEFSEAIDKKSSALRQEQKAVYLEFIKGNPNSLVSLFALKIYAGAVPDVAQVEPVFNTLSVSVRSSKMGTEYGAEIARMKRTAIGAIAPDFTQTDTSGRAVSLHDYKGKYVLLDFWASWCGPCRAENPNVVKNFNAYKDKGFTVLGVSLDQPNAKDKWVKAVHDDHLEWTQVSDLKGWKNEAAQLYAVKAIPQNFLIGPDGTIIGKDLHGDGLSKKLAEIFNK
ncbi:TlpA disulfide reductase family protein [Mucilaginibacter sp. KACC 22773]|uniref:TlpA disulfide reductase family protein n=1 Tax=Mucilaginibacter sp. KACC 22773 TaxID=3025671 RepID=UPI0023660A5C|nr:TlpA disulfide reductase family protein [Mucilaginibacter sp. KACC 22773]WDF77133.1 TlpA disulfide reductase family protein [Mucilaginibacter sp. KACC 22773]